MVFDKAARAVAAAQKEHEQIFPLPGWWSTTRWKLFAARR
jgi:glycerol kinase